MSSRLLVPLLSVLLLVLCIAVPCHAQGVLGFTLRTANAGWSARSVSNVEWYTHSLTATLTNGSTVTWPGRVMIMQGNGEGSAQERSNDIWASGDQGISWHLIAGRTNTGQGAAGPRADTSFPSPALSRPATAVDRRNFIYRIGGSDPLGSRRDNVYMSYDGGQSWVDQSARTGATRFTPPRERGSLIVDNSDNLYLLAGQGQSTMTSAAYKSSNQGVTWTALPNTPWRARSTAQALVHNAQRLGLGQGREVMTFLSGWDGTDLFNDVWVSSDRAESWVKLNGTMGNNTFGNAPWLPRDAANAEITQFGVIVLVGGQSRQGTADIPVNDVWVSLDGGYSWGLCVEDAEFGDRRDLMTLLDDQDFLYVIGGADWRSGAVFNDVWRSAFSFRNYSAILSTCGVSIPACGVGLTCWPGPTTSFFSNGSVNCPANRVCARLPEISLGFSLQASAAGWAPRFLASAELMPKAVAYTAVGGGARTAPAGSIIVQGGGGQRNDVWLSSDQGRTWNLIAGYARYSTEGQGPDIRAGGTAYGTSYSPPLSETTGIVDAKAGVIYRVGGATADYSQIRNDVWRSTNGLAWTKMAATNLPGRFGAAVVVDDKAKLYVAGGIAPNSVILNDFWTSTNNGATFTAPSQRPGFMASNGRAKAFLLHRRSSQLNRDVLYFGTGWNSVTLNNDIWASSDDGASWTIVCSAAPFSRRDAASAEITNAGLIIVAGGQASVWVSGDGGYTWGLCAYDAAWSDRREVATVLDSEEHLLVMGGRDNLDAPFRSFNDVHRSSFSFANTTALQSACGLSIPACGIGMTCFPEAPGTRVTLHGVTCPLLEFCQRGGRLSSSAAPRVVSSTARRVDPCDLDPQYDPECYGYVFSTGSSDNSSSASIPLWLVAVIVVIAFVLVIGVLWWYKSWYKPQQQQRLGLNSDEALLSSGGGTSDALNLQTS